MVCEDGELDILLGCAILAGVVECVDIFDQTFDNGGVLGGKVEAAVDGPLILRLAIVITTGSLRT